MSPTIIASAREIARGAIERLARDVERECVSAAPVGRIADGIRVRTDGHAVVVTLAPEASHGWYVEYGRPALRGPTMPIADGIYRRSARAVEPRPFLRSAIARVIARWT